MHKYGEGKGRLFLTFSKTKTGPLRFQFPYTVGCLADSAYIDFQNVTSAKNRELHDMTFPVPDVIHNAANLIGSQFVMVRSSWVLPWAPRQITKQWSRRSRGKADFIDVGITPGITLCS
jgi:hypothetical protein